MRLTIPLAITKRSFLVMAAVGMLLTLALGARASAHGGLIVGVPGPGQAAGGSIDVVQLFFLEEITAAEVSVTAPDGSEIAGDLEQPTIDLLEYTIPELSTEGPYIVNYGVDFVDGTSFESAYQFTYDLSAPAVLPIEVANRRPGTSIGQRIALGVLVAAIVGLVGLLGWRLRELRAARAVSIR
jgi:hypothetical protein